MHVNTKNFQKRKEGTDMDITKDNAAFCDALKIELATTDINTGYNPNNCIYMKPVAAFLLAIIKSPDIQIQNDIGKIFKGHNIIDYTCFDKTLNTGHFYKSLAYTSLYKASSLEDDTIKAGDVTATLVSSNIPQQLFDDMTKTGITTEKTGNGIYQFKGSMLFHTQIIVYSEMGETEQEWLKSLINYVQEDFFPRLMLLGLDKCSKMFI